MDADILIALKKGHRPTELYQRKLRKVLPAAFPGSTFYFQAADIVTQVLNFGITSQLSLQVEAMDLAVALQYARRLADLLRTVPGSADVHVNQVLDYPTLQVNVDRTRAADLGLSQKDVAFSVLTALASSVLVAPTFFLNPHNNVNYSVAVQVPISQVTSIEELQYLPLTAPAAGAILQPDIPRPPSDIVQVPSNTIADVATIRHRISPENINHYTIQRVVGVDLSVDGRDLGSVAGDIRKKIDELGKLPPGVRIALRGQNEVMEQSFRSLGLGLILAIMLVYFLMVVLFQSWLDPLIIMIAVPGALVGIVWMLLLTGTTINVESLMGAIMAVGIATSNSILLVSFANDMRVEEGKGALDAVVHAASTRLRPVLMTALAMILGMLPMALAFGEGGEQNAPLGRAVIGGLFLATAATLFVVPVIYVRLRQKPPVKYLLDRRFLAEEQGEEARRLPL
jgi:multidrug efflux pump subunit AcrB